MSKEFMYFTSGVTYRVPVNSDGTLGVPEIMKKWTSETYAPKKKVVSKKVVDVVAKGSEVVW